MNYGVLVLGATIQISLFLRLCSVSADIYTNDIFNPRLPFLEPHSHNEFQESISFNPTVYSWLTGRKNYVMDKMLWESFAPSSAREEQLLLAFMAGREDQIMYPADVPNYDKTGGIGEYCENFENKYKAKQAKNAYRASRESHELQRVPNKTNRVPGPTIDVLLPEGCSFVNKDFLYCNGPNIDEVPTIRHDLEYFDMNQTNVVKINANAFESIQIKGMRLNKNRITDVDEKAFDGVRGLKTLEISHNQLCWIWFEYIIGLDEATVLYLEHNEIFLDRPDLVESGKPVEDHKPTLRSLLILTLTGNPLSIIPEMFFASLRTSPVTLLSLQACSLTYIHPDAFTHLHNLTILDLSENPNLTPNLAAALSGVRNNKLENLALAHNSLQVVPKDALEIVKSSLRELDLRGNSLLTTLSRDSFPEEMPAMRSLNLDSCAITTIGNNAFDGMPNLDTLILKQNRLSTVPLSITKLVKMSVLDLSAQKIGGKFLILPDTFSLLKNLRILLLNDLTLQTLEKSALNGLIGLNMLVLANTKLTSLEDFTFDGLRTLRSLDLRNNNLGAINSNTFYGLGNLQNLNLQSCGLSIPLERKRELVPHLGSTTPIPRSESADERFIVQKPVIDFATVGRAINDLIRSITGEEEEPEQGSTSEPFKYLTRLQYLYLENNKIRDLSAKLFGHMKYLAHVDLSRNAVEIWFERVFENNTALAKVLLQNNNIITVTDAMFEDLRFVTGALNADLSGNPFICDKGTCQLNQEVFDKSIKLLTWDYPDLYTCTYLPTMERIKLTSLNEAMCSPSTDSQTSSTSTLTTLNETEAPNSPKSNEDDQPGPSSTILTAAIVASCSLLFICGSVVFYKKRLHLKYFWFAAKMNIKGLPRKTRDSELISESHDYDVFISYSHHDSEFIQESLVPELEGRGKLMDGNRYEKVIEMDGDPAELFRVCLHERDFEVGTPITENIIECVDKSRKVIVLVSKKYLESQWCLFEMNLAYHRLVESRRKSFLVIVLEEIPNDLRTKVLNYLMRSRTYIQWPGKDAPPQEIKLFWTRLRSSLASDD